MANPDHVEIVKQRAEANNQRLDIWFDLRACDLRKANLRGVNLSSDLSGADLREANLHGANLTEAKLREADLDKADLIEGNFRWANLHGANLTEAKLRQANLHGADLTEAKLWGADLRRADLRDSNLHGADLRGADLREANLHGANLREIKLANTHIGWTAFGDCDLSLVESLSTIQHHGPSTVGLDALAKSKGCIPEEFLKGCGLAPWEILQARMYDPALTPHQISELQIKIFDQRTHGPLAIAGVFISYSHANSDFVDELRERLTDAGTVVWLDRHDLEAGDLQKQVARAIRLQDVVVLVLSKESIDSDWVENELDMARRKEKQEKRDVLCPVALDDSWKAKLDTKSPNRALWRTLTHKVVLDFSQDFETAFEKLVRGLKKNYPPAAQD